MAYASACDVGALTRNLLGSACEYGSSTSPTDTQVNSWLSTGCAVINATVGGAITDTDAQGVAQQANALFAAWMAERSRINTRTAADERTRADMFKKDFDTLMDVLRDLDAASLGLSEDASLAYAGGISAADKSSVESNSDRVAPRFSRGMFKNPDALTPHSSGS